ncbi:hypothetical protein BDV25DRAFT_86624 [Aspergillus avenaceus]|uniref:Quinate/shikimate 5-dehydrogenase/glutamyl-tRNA reductase domain-containing protein n=1 Tax=Aspergillus avenaceus TaxID=36643 RepID=A0A5N6U0B3_ASPAV|nr:hypothetical protein BDV25DRAFT_86624 [Aspergillus avenaceus]
MPSSDTTNTAIKIIALPAKGDSAGVTAIFKPTGEITGLVSASQVTAFRTALTTMFLFHRVSHFPKKRVAIFGSGKQVERHLRLALLLASREIESITVINRGRQRLDLLEKDIVSGLRVVFGHVSFTLIAKEDATDYDATLKSELAYADAIFCCTPSTAPLFTFGFLRNFPKKRFISMIGSYKPHRREVDTDTILSGERVFVDSKEVCLEESGELWLRSGSIWEMRLW